MYCCKWVSAAEDHCTHKAAAKQREDNIFTPDGENDRNNRRQQTQEAIVHDVPSFLAIHILLIERLLYHT